MTRRRHASHEIRSPESQETWEGTSQDASAGSGVSGWGAAGFVDRASGGRALAMEVVARLGPLPPGSDRPLVLGLPRGGVPVAFEVARALGAELDVTVVRKIGAPGRPELGVGALAEDETPVFDERHLAYLGLTPKDLAGTVARETAELRRRLGRYRGKRPQPNINGRLVVVVDDGLATGVTARAALRSLRKAGPRRLIFAAPVCAADSTALLAGDADEVICVAKPEPFRAVGAWYADFSQTTDDEVVEMLRRAAGERPDGRP